MLPFFLKVIWFCLSFTGIIPCWIVLYLFSRAIGSYWGPMSYCVFATLLQGIFCLGMIYDMNPFRMPKIFCIVQTFVIYYSAWSLTGICAAFTFATSSAVLWPSPTKISASSTLAWKNKYYLPILAFPLTCLSISVPVLLNINAIQPTDDLHCDASHPEWGRFLGYAGFSMILTIPCLFLSTSVARRVYQMHHEIQRSCKHSIGRLHSRSHTSKERNLLPGRLKSPISPEPDTATPASVDIEMLCSPQSTSGKDGPLYDIADMTPSTTFDVLSASQKRTDTWEVLGSTEEEKEDFSPRKQMGDTMLSSSTPVAPPRPNLAPAIWRLILFQMAFFIIQCLAALSTVIDVAQRRPTPTPFGSQHVALILVGWGPAVVFGHLPAVRRQLMFWRR